MSQDDKNKMKKKTDLGQKIGKTKDFWFDFHDSKSFRF